MQSDLKLEYKSILIFINPNTDRGVMSDHNKPYFYWVEMGRAWADDSNDVSHLSISHYNIY